MSLDDNAEAGDFLLDDGSIDERAVRNRRMNRIGEDLCRSIRRRLVGSQLKITDLADGPLQEHSRTAIGRHARGKCKHDIDEPAVKRVYRWERREGE